MGVLYSIGDALVTADELQVKSTMGKLEPLGDARATASVEFSTGTVTTADVLAQRNDSPIPFAPLGLGKPLGIEVMSTYTGDAPGRSFFDKVLGKGKPDLLAVSGVKAAQTFGAAPRAINQLIEDIDDFRLYRFGALRDGTPVVFYSPAITDPTCFVSIELVADSFSGDIFDHVKSLFTVAAGLPVFAPAATVLIAGSVISGIAKKLAGAILETAPFLRADEDIRFGSAGIPMEVARFVVFSNDGDAEELRQYKAAIRTDGDTRVVLANKQTDEEYRGKKPYVIAAFDGAPKKELEKFAPQHASAAMLEQFYGDAKSRGAAVVGVLQDAMTLYNDLAFRKKAEQLKREADTLAAGSQERARLEELLQACIKNIATDALRHGFAD